MVQLRLGFTALYYIQNEININIHKIKFSQSFIKCSVHSTFLFISCDFPTSFPFLPLEVKQHKVSFLFNNQPGAPVIQMYSVLKLYVFRASFLPIIRSFPLYIRHWQVSCRFLMTASKQSQDGSSHQKLE